MKEHHELDYICIDYYHIWKELSIMKEHHELELKKAQNDFKEQVAELTSALVSSLRIITSVLIITIYGRSRSLLVHWSLLEHSQTPLFPRKVAVGNMLAMVETLEVRA